MIIKIALGVAGGIGVAYLGSLGISYVEKDAALARCEAPIKEAAATVHNSEMAVRMMVAICMERSGYKAYINGADIDFIKITR